MPELTSNVCFECRKAFKRPIVHYYEECSFGDQKWYACPECGELMQHMGEHFKAPANGDLKEWARIKSAIERGEDWAIRKPRKGER